MGAPVYLTIAFAALFVLSLIFNINLYKRYRAEKFLLEVCRRDLSIQEAYSNELREKETKLIADLERIKKEPTLDARQLLHDLTHGGAVVKVSVIDPSGLLIYRGGAR
jgi:cell division protein FtsB